MDGAGNLLERAVALFDEDDPLRIEFEVELGEAWLESGRLSEAGELMAHGCPSGLAPVTSGGQSPVGLALVRVQTEGTTRKSAPIEPLVGSSRPRATAGAADVLRLLGGWPRGRGTPRLLRVHERALAHARAVGTSDARRGLGLMVSNALWGPEPVEEALARCWAIHDTAIDESRPIALSGSVVWRALLAASMPLARRSPSPRGDGRFRPGPPQGAQSDVAVVVEMLAGDFEAAEQARMAYARSRRWGTSCTRPLRDCCWPTPWSARVG